ncbi:MAG: phytoene desaturase [Cryomorphaceae bacterium]|nr:phytoene desaturase [Cryomorphaceae bacterium]
MPQPKALVVGAGVAGLATALRLKGRGYDVEVFEAAMHPGGKMGEWASEGYRFDTGPSLFTLPHLVEETIASVHSKTSDYFTYSKHQTACAYFWEDGTELLAEGDVGTFSKKSADILGGNARAIAEYFSEAAKMYDITKGVFLERSLHRWQTYLTKDVWKAIPKLPTLGLFSSLHQRNQKRLGNNDKLVQLFDRFATYNGSSPYLTPGIMQMICHLEHGIGTFYPHGGMSSIPKAMFNAGKDAGIEYHFGQNVEKIHVENNRATAITVNGNLHKADVVVCNVDVRSAYKHLLTDVSTPKNVVKQKPSSSAIIFYWGIKQQFPKLDLHNIFFSEDYKAEFDAIFSQDTLYEDPTVYINISAKVDENDAPKGCENWFVMINVPADSGQDWDTLTQQAKQFIIEKLNRMLAVDVSALIETENILTPPLIELKTSSQGGALYGSSSNERMAAFFRHANFHHKIGGLYFCGGSVHPGGGIPLCMHSARITSDLITNDQL